MRGAEDEHQQRLILDGVDDPVMQDVPVEGKGLTQVTPMAPARHSS
jgi:hypothetical protein